MGNGSVLARAFAGGVKGGTEALRKADETKLSEFQKFQGMEAKFAWGTEQDRLARNENIRRFGQELKGKKSMADYGLQKRTEERGIIKQENIQEVKDRLSEVITDPKDLFWAKNMADKNFSFAEIAGTPAKKVTPEQEKAYFELAALAVEAGDSRPVAVIANERIADHNRRVTGQLDINKRRQGGINDSKKVTSAIDNIRQEITSDKVSGIHSLRQLASGKPQLYKQVLAKLITEGVLLKGDVAEIEGSAKGVPVLPTTPGGRLTTPADVLKGLRRKAQEPTDLEGVLSFSGRER